MDRSLSILGHIDNCATWGEPCQTCFIKSNNLSLNELHLTRINDVVSLDLWQGEVSPCSSLASYIRSGRSSLLRIKWEDAPSSSPTTPARRTQVLGPRCCLHDLHCQI